MGIAAQRFVLAALLTQAVMSTGLAAERQATMNVGAYVEPRLELRVAQSPRTLSVSTADVQAGFIEVHGASALDVRTNDREGYVVEIRPMLADFADVDIAYGDGIARMSGETVRLVRRNPPATAAPLTLSYRFRLAPGVLPGVYPWPLDIAATPL